MSTRERIEIEKTNVHRAYERYIGKMRTNRRITQTLQRTEAAELVVRRDRNTFMEQEKHTILQEMSFQRAAGWIAIIGTTTFVVGFFAFLLLSLWRAEEWMINIIKDHFAGIYVIPLAAIGALCVVLVLRFTSGPIEFEAYGVKFKGSSGPVVFWILCFLAVVGGTKLLW